MNASRKSRGRTVLAGLSLLAILWLLVCGMLYHAMRQPPEAFGRFMTRLPLPAAFMVLPFETLWTRARLGTLQVGDRAPDFSLVRLDKTAQIRVSDFAAQHRPVVLVFGSYT
jgi:hypothetical protein